MFSNRFQGIIFAALVNNRHGAIRWAKNAFQLKPYSQNPKYRDLIRNLWHYVVYNAENMTETDFLEMDNDVRETTGDSNMSALEQIFIEKEAKGKAEGKVDSIIELLEDNFGEVPEATKNTVAKITDLAVLRRLTLLAGKCKSLAEFNKALK